ncbi:MAG: HlyC/CorC family transporter [Acidobacteria bacterium]|nr:HlyC/CorC family transporter [Acidobacteriota bacterium]
MNFFSVGAGLALLFAAGCSIVYMLLSVFAQALESLSTIRRKALLEEHPERFQRILASGNVQVSRVAVRVTAQAAVLGGLLSLGTALAAFQSPEPWLVAALAILFGWALLETLVIRLVLRRGADALLKDFVWLIPVVGLLSAPLTPFLSRLLVKESEEHDDPGASGPAPRDSVTKDAEVRALLDVAREEGILEKHEEELVSRAVDFGDRTVGEVMTPRPDMVVAEADAPLDDVADLFVKTKYTRIPLVEGQLDKPVGVVHVKDVFSVLRTAEPPATIRPLSREVLFVPESQVISTLLGEFRRTRTHMAIVVDEYGAVTGLVTVEDCIEELVGEIADEHEDSLDPIVSQQDGSYSLAGRVRVSEVESLFETKLPESESGTVAGFVSERLGHIPRVGENLTVAGLLFEVEEADRRRIQRVVVRKAPPAEHQVKTFE